VGQRDRKKTRSVTSVLKNLSGPLRGKEGRLKKQTKVKK